MEKTLQLIEDHLAHLHLQWELCNEDEVYYYNGGMDALKNLRDELKEAKKEEPMYPILAADAVSKEFFEKLTNLWLEQQLNVSFEERKKADKAYEDFIRKNNVADDIYYIDEGRVVYGLMVHTDFYVEEFPNIGAFEHFRRQYHHEDGEQFVADFLNKHGY